MAERLYLPVDVYESRPPHGPRGLSRIGKILWSYLHNLQASKMHGFFSFALPDIGYFLDETEEDILEGLAELEAKGALVRDADYFFLPQHAELTGSTRFSFHLWRGTLRCALIEYHGTQENRAWRAFHARFEEMIAEAIASDPPPPPDDPSLSEPPANETRPPMVTLRPGAGAIALPVSTPPAPTAPKPALDPIARLMQQLEDGRPDELLGNGMLRAKSTNLERGWMVLLYNSYGEARVRKAIDDTYAKFKTATRDKIEAALKGENYSYYEDDRNRAPNTPDASGKVAVKLY